MMRGLIKLYLKWLARIKLTRTAPTVIGVTGSFGKTTAKEAIYTILSTRYTAYRSQKSYNTDIGILLSVLEQNSAFRSPVKWLATLAKATWNAFLGRGAQYLILEYGADKPGDIEELIGLSKAHIAVMTRIGQVHQATGQFPTLEAIFLEKQKMVTSLNAEDFAILNYADPFIKQLHGRLRAHELWFNGKDLGADHVINTETGFDAHIHGKDGAAHAQFSIPGSFHLDSLLPALLVGNVCGISLAEGVHALKNFRLPPGRMSLIPGINGSLLLDSTYNASPETVREALALLKEYPAKRRIAVLGNMNELGVHAHAAHAKLAENIGSWLDMLVTVGDHSRITAETCLKHGFPRNKISTLGSAQEAGNLLAGMLKEGDLVLLKGSQNRVRLERATKMLMRSPEQAPHLLCRQENAWERIG